jgi:hypothetical protein
VPEGSLGEALGDGELQGLQGFGEWCTGRLADEEMDMLGHNDVAENFKSVTFAGEFE